MRAARAYGEARREGRVLDGVCVDPPHGFRISEALAIYGGEAAVATECLHCPANVLADANSAAVAGCYGLLPLPEDPAVVHEAIEQATHAAYGSINWSLVCPATQPRWYGLWIDSPLWAEHLLVRYLILSAAVIKDATCRRAVAELLLAFNVAYEANVPLHVRLYPRGRLEGNWWLLVAHCPRCKAAWHDERSRRCSVCGYAGNAAPVKRRRARGRRPYVPLSRLLGTDEAAAFLVRYEVFRRQPRLTDQA